MGISTWKYPIYFRDNHFSFSVEKVTFKKMGTFPFISKISSSFYYSMIYHLLSASIKSLTIIEQCVKPQASKPYSNLVVKVVVFDSENGVENC